MEAVEAPVAAVRTAISICTGRSAKLDYSAAGGADADHKRLLPDRDVEATCSDDGSVSRHQMEMIEIGAVMQSARTFEVESEFQSPSP